jgi:hypothetical protein
MEKEILKKEAPVLAHADLTVDRIAIAGVVSEVATLGDGAESRATWSQMVGDHLGRHRFGKLPIVSFSDMRAILGRDDHSVLLDRFKDDGECNPAILADLRMVLDGKARFVVFGNIQEDRVEWAESESEVVDKKTKKTTSKTKTMTTSRITTVRLRFYDLTDQRLVWDHYSVGQASASKEHDMMDIVEHDPKEGFLGGLLTSLVNSSLKPDPRYPATPEFESSLAVAFDNVGAYLKPSKNK